MPKGNKYGITKSQDRYGNAPADVPDINPIVGDNVSIAWKDRQVAGVHPDDYDHTVTHREPDRTAEKKNDE